MTYLQTIVDQTKRSIWSLKNLIDCIPDDYWNKKYCEMPLWKHVYHTIHSLDRWYINPECYCEPEFHVENLNNLDVQTEKQLTRNDIMKYLETVTNKILNYLETLSDTELLQIPEKCKYSKLHLIIAQHRHLDMHIGMIMGIIIADTGNWPRVMGLESDFLDNQSLYF